MISIAKRTLDIKHPVLKYRTGQKRRMFVMKGGKNLERTRYLTAYIFRTNIFEEEDVESLRKM